MEGSPPEGFIEQSRAELVPEVIAWLSGGEESIAQLKQLSAFVMAEGKKLYDVSRRPTETHQRKRSKPDEDQVLPYSPEEVAAQMKQFHRFVIEKACKEYLDKGPEFYDILVIILHLCAPNSTILKHMSTIDSLRWMIKYVNVIVGEAKVMVELIALSNSPIAQKYAENPTSTWKQSEQTDIIGLKDAIGFSAHYLRHTCTDLYFFHELQSLRVIPADREEIYGYISRYKVASNYLEAHSADIFKMMTEGKFTPEYLCNTTIASFNE